MLPHRSKIVEFCSPKIQISISRNIIQKIFDEVATSDELRPNLETGGSFIGKIGVKATAWESMQIISLIPPGPDAVYQRNYCGLDREFQREMIQVCQKNDNAITYCGDWHYHPYTIENPSLGDLQEDLKSIQASLQDDIQNAGFLYAIVSFHHRSRLSTWLWVNHELVSPNQRWKIKFFFLQKNATSYLHFSPNLIDEPLFVPKCCNAEKELALLTAWYGNEFTITSQNDVNGINIILTKTIYQKQVAIKFILAPSFPYQKPEIFISTNDQRWFTIDQLRHLQKWHYDFHIVNLMHDIYRQIFPENLVVANER